MGSGDGGENGNGKWLWIIRGIQVGIPTLWILTLVLGGFSTVIDEISAPAGGLPYHKTELPGTALPIPLSLFALGFFLLLGPAIMVWDAYILLSWLSKRGSWNPENR